MAFAGHRGQCCRNPIWDQLPPSDHGPNPHCERSRDVRHRDCRCFVRDVHRQRTRVPSTRLAGRQVSGDSSAKFGITTGLRRSTGQYNTATVSTYSPYSAASVCAGPARRFPADLHHEREDIEAQLAALAKTTSQATDPALLNQLPISGDVLPDLPSALKAPPVRRLRPGSAVEQAASKPPCSPRSPTPPWRPSRASWIPARPAITTLTRLPSPTDPASRGSEHP